MQCDLAWALSPRVNGRLVLSQCADVTGSANVAFAPSQKYELPPAGRLCSPPPDLCQGLAPDPGRCGLGCQAVGGGPLNPGTRAPEGRGRGRPAEPGPQLWRTVASVQNCRLRVAPPIGSSFLLYFSRKFCLCHSGQKVPAPLCHRTPSRTLGLSCVSDRSELYFSPEAGP